MQNTKQNDNLEIDAEGIEETDATDMSPPVERAPDGSLEEKIGNTTYKVNVFFDHDSGFNAVDKIKRLILAEKFHGIP